MKAVMMSIQPKWCELIAWGKKTVEVRKTKPKLQTPFKVYIYCTQNKDGKYFWSKEVFEGKLGRYAVPHVGNGKVIGEFVCDLVDEFKYNYCPHPEIGMDYDCGDNWWEIADEDLEQACLTYDEFKKYVWGYKEVYGWHISNLVIYDEPRALGEFIVPSKIGCCNEGKCRGCKYLDRGNGFNIEDDCNATFSTDEFKPLRRPPQSWCYVEEVE